MSSHSTPQVCPEKLRKSGCISEEEVFAVTMLKISSYLLSHFHFSVTFFFTVNRENFNHAKHPEPSIGASNEGPTAALDPEDGQVQCVHMGLLQVSSNEVRIASDESKILG